MQFPDFWLAPHSTTEEAALDLCLELRKHFSFKEMRSIFLASIAILLDNKNLPEDTHRVLSATVQAGVAAVANGPR